MMEQIKKQQWSALIEIEPMLGELQQRARNVKDEDGNHFCANAVWYSEFKPTLVNLAGFEAKDRRLRSMRAYDLAYGTVYNELPACRNCACF
jgi:hypothetical protein